MKLPIPSLLYLTSLGLFGFTGWTVYRMLPMWKLSVREAATSSGQEEARKSITRGKGQGGVTLAWNYGDSTKPWWGQFKDANLIGKLPPPPKPPDEDVKPVDPPPPPVTPLEQIIDLVAIVHDPVGAGGKSHVVVRYRPEANVQPPEWYVRENAAPTASAAPPGGRDVVAAARPAPRPQPASPPGKQPTNTPRPSTPMPTSSVGKEVLQKLWIDDGGDERRSARLWPPYSDIRLVGVKEDASSAFFSRTPPPPKNGEPPAEPKVEELLKSALGLSQDVLLAIRRWQGRGDSADRRPTEGAPTAVNKWVDVDETTLVGKTVNIGRQDEKRFRENSDEFLRQIDLDTYVSKSSSLAGLQVRNVDPQLAQRYGVQQGDVLIEVNGRAVRSRTQALQFGKADYERGVRTFQTKWWSNGQVVERIFQAPDR